jgi:glycopeptide antibiotics resistance protein
MSQYITKRGFFQVDDIVTNTLGSLIGFLVFTMLYWVFQTIKKSKK